MSTQIPDSHNDQCKKIGIEKISGFHRIRHTFGTSFLKQGGNELYLMQQLGHSTLQMTRKYVQMDVEVLKAAQVRTGFLARLKQK